jgi:prepilin-type N-terminal cleavage/methylation domain-containing protein
MNPIISSRRASHRRRAFTLVEIMMVVTIIGLLALVAMPALMRTRTATRYTRFASDLRTFAQAYETYSLSTGGWPPNAGNGVVPAGMSGYLRDNAWTSFNSLGGRWNWDMNNFGVTASISTTGVTLNDAEMTVIDAKIDDGVLTTGIFQKTSGRFLYILVP